MTIHDPALAEAAARVTRPQRHEIGAHEKLHVLADAMDGVQGLICNAEDGSAISDACMTAIFDVFSDQLRAIADTVPKH